MKATLIALVFAFSIGGCATPVTMVKHGTTGQVARCGGGIAGSIAGGVIGYNIEQSSDRSCVQDYESRGFRRIGAVETTPAPVAAGIRSPERQSPPASVVPETGRDAYVAERLAREINCNIGGMAKLLGKGPGYESYSMACTNGDTLLIRCEFGNCRVLK